MVRIDGVDLSHWQAGSMDFAAAKAAGIRFVWHKATESNTYHDVGYPQRRTAVKAAGLRFGGYHFARTNGDAATQAHYFLDYAKPVKGDMLPVLDIETNDAGLSQTDLTAWIGRFVATIRTAAHCGVVIYTPFDLTNDFGCPLWIARYSDAMTVPTPKKPWTHWTAWQFSDGAYPHGGPNSVPGIGHCDINTLAGDPAQTLTTLTIGGTMTDPTLAKVNVSNPPFKNGSYSTGPKYADQDTLDRYQQADDNDLHYGGTNGSGLTIIQGSFHTGYAPSAGTHDGSGVCDLDGTYQPGAKQTALAKVGCVYFYRTAADGFSVHGHTVSAGNPHLEWLARSQITSFYAGRNGLANGGPFRLAPGAATIPHLVNWHGNQAPPDKPVKPQPPANQWPAWTTWPGLAKSGWGEGQTSPANLRLSCAVGIRGYAGWYGDQVDQTWDWPAMRGLQRWQINHQPWAGQGFVEAAWNALGHIPLVPHDSADFTQFTLGKKSHESFFTQMLLVLQGFAAELNQRAERTWRPNAVVAVKAFQAHVGITVDGVVGPVTWAHLWETHK